jgi:twitching motility protein PilT
MLAESLTGIVAQQLLKRADGSGRVAAHEVLVGTPAIASTIRESKTTMIPSLIQSGSQDGMRGLDQTLEQLVREGVVSAEAALEKANDKQYFASLPSVAGKLPPGLGV